MIMRVIQITTNKMMMNSPVKKFLTILYCSILISCSQLTDNKQEPVESLNLDLTNEANFEIPFYELGPDYPQINFPDYEYRVSKGDIISIMIWGQNEAFPIAAINSSSSPLFARTIDERGNIFIPYIGPIPVEGLTFFQVREIVTKALSSKFINPQVDISLESTSNKNKVFVLGEINRPLEIELGVSELSLTSAINQASGLNLLTANPRRIYVIRNYNESPAIYLMKLDNPDAYLRAVNFILFPEDIVFVETSTTSRWNRFIRNIFPFAQIVNQIDQVSTRN